MRVRTVSGEIPATRITLLRLVWPDAMVTEERGTFKSFAKKSMQTALALPSMGGAVSATFSASPVSPVMALFVARGCTLTAKLTPASVCCIGINCLAAPFSDSDTNKNHRNSYGDVNCVIADTMGRE